MDPAGRPLVRAVEVLLPHRPGVRAETTDLRALLAAVNGTWRLAEVDAQGQEVGERETEEVDLRFWLHSAIFGAQTTTAGQEGAR